MKMPILFKYNTYGAKFTKILQDEPCLMGAFTQSTLLTTPPFPPNLNLFKK